MQPDYQILGALVPDLVLPKEPSVWDRPINVLGVEQEQSVWDRPAESLDDPLSAWNRPIELLGQHVGWGYDPVSATISAVAELGKVTADAYVAIDKQTSEEAEKNNARKEADAALAAAKTADIQAKNALAKALFSAQLAAQTSAASDADPGDARKADVKRQAIEKATTDQAAADSALAASDHVGQTLSPGAKEKRLAAVRDLAAKAETAYNEKHTASEKVKNDPKKYAMARAAEKAADASRQAAQKLMTRLASAEIAAASANSPSAPSSETGTSFFDRKTGPFSNLSLILCGILLLGGGAVWLRRSRS